MGRWEGGFSTSGRAIDGLGSAVQHLGVFDGVELHFFSCLFPLSVLHAAKLSLGSGLTVPVSVRNSLDGSANQCGPFSSRPAVPVQPYRCHQTSPDYGPRTLLAVSVTTSLNWFHFSTGPPPTGPISSKVGREILLVFS